MFYWFVSFLNRAWWSIIARGQKKDFAECGQMVHVGHYCDMIPSHIHCGHHIHIGPHASFIASISHIYIGNYVMFGPNVTIRGGNHRIDVIGKHIYEVGGGQKSYLKMIKMYILKMVYGSVVMLRYLKV